MSAIKQRREVRPGGSLSFGSQVLWYASKEVADEAMRTAVAVTHSSEPQRVTLGPRRAALN